jgi:DNA-binding NarL/FixJ family response regulator
MSAKTITVAVVDDHTIMRSELSKHIELMGFNVVVQAENGKKAIDKINEAPQKPSVCLLDLNMPVMDGIAAARQLSKLYPNMRILGNSVNNDTASIISFL